jgi:TonB-linked SusC/RagA family outer membrane protein
MRKSFFIKQQFIKRCLTGITTFLLLLAACPVFAQTGAVSGTVTDVAGEPLIGVNVIVKGTTIGAITDVDGKYSLQQVPASATLTFSYVGYIAQEIAVGNQRTINVQLRDDTQRLEEVVVVGYGTQQKRDITGSVAVVDTKTLQKSTGSSSMQQLQGKAAGVYIGTTAAPGSQTMVRIRGVNTVNDNGPLYVVDGVSTRNQDLSSLNPNDIESMQVLKDASSAAIYGAQAANGVILITTKKGTSTGQPVLTYDGYFTLQKSGKQYDLLNAQERLQLEWESQSNRLKLAGSSALPSHLQFGSSANGFTIPNYMTSLGAGGATNIDPNTYSYPDNVMVPFSDTDWWSEVDRVAPIQSHQISLSGGTDKGQYNMSVNYYDQQGVMIHTFYKKYTARANSSYNIRPWLRFGENFSYTWSRDLGRSPQGAESNAYSWAYRATPWVPVYDIKGNFAGSKINGTGNWQNPVAILTRDQNNYWSNSRIFGNVWGELDLMKGLTFRTSFGLDYTNNYSYRMSKKNLEFSESPKTNDLEEQAGFNFRWVWSNTLTYNRTFNNVHKLQVILGTEAIRDGLGRSMTARRFGYLFEDNINTWVLDLGENNAQREAKSSYKGEFALFGMFARADYSYQDKYLLTAIVRRDGVSRFSANNRYGTFPSISAGWRISEEAFMASTRTWIDDLKLRAGYGQAGNSEVPRKTNFAYEYTTAADRTNYDLGGANTGGTLGYRLERFGNENTKWEAIENINVALDGTFLNGKFGGTLEYYVKTTRDMLVEASYSALAGEPTKPFINFGNVRNTGWEATLNYRDSHGDFAWDIALNLSHYKNEVLQLSSAEDYTMWQYGARLDGQPVTRITKGHPIAEFYGYRVDGFYTSVDDVLNMQPIGLTLKPEEAKAYVGRFKFADINKNGYLDVDDREVLGSPHPDLIAGLNIGLSYKNFDFSMFWYSTMGNEMMNNTRSFIDFNLFSGNRSKRMLYESWRLDGDNSKAKLPLLNDGDTYSRSYMSSYYVEDASFLRMKNIMLGYTFPKELLRKATIQNLRLYLQAENALTFTKYSGLDPEFTNADINEDNPDRRRGVDMGGWPNVMRFTVGLNFVF